MSESDSKRGWGSPKERKQRLKKNRPQDTRFPSPHVDDKPLHKGGHMDKIKLVRTVKAAG